MTYNISSIKYNLEDLAAFIYVAKLKSFAKAANFLKLSSSTISDKITRLEKSLKVTLFARTTRVVNLTNDGEVFFQYCKRLMAELDVFHELMQKLHGVNGVLKIAIPPYFSRYYIVPYLLEFLENYPNLKLDIFLTEDPIDIITKGYDLQLRIQKPHDEDLEVAKLMTNRKVICASAKYLERHGIPFHPRDLLNHNCLVFGENEVWRFRHKTTQEIVELKDMNGNIICSNGEIIKELLLYDAGVTIKSARDIEEEIKSNYVVLLFPEYEVINETMFYAVYPRSYHIPERIKVFIKFFQKKFEECSMNKNLV